MPIGLRCSTFVNGIDIDRDSIFSVEWFLMYSIRSASDSLEVWELRGNAPKISNSSLTLLASAPDLGSS